MIPVKREHCRQHEKARDAAVIEVAHHLISLDSNSLTGGDVFTYDGPVDTEPYGMEVALAMLPLTLPDEHGRLALCDPVQGPMLDEALALAKPSKKKGSKRSRGERRCWLRGPSVRGRRLRLRGSCRRGWRSRVRPGSAGRPTSRANAKWSPQPARSAPLENFGLFGMRKLPFMVRVEGKKFSTQKPKL